MDNLNQIVLNGLQTKSVIGVYDWERIQPRPLVVDLTLTLASELRFTKDALDETVDYQAVTECIDKLCHESQFQLLETLAEYIATTLLQNFPLQSVSIRLHKPKILPQVNDVQVHLVRHV